MSQEGTSKQGTVGWMDLTVPNADQVRDFYAEVAGWRPEPVDMGGYADYNMCHPVTGTPLAGVCHARGGNADVPPVWLLYIHVDDLDASLAACAKRGGTVLTGPKQAGGQGRYAVVRDPAGAPVALFEQVRT